MSDLCDGCEEHICPRTCVKINRLQELVDAQKGTDNLQLQVLPMATPWGTRHLVVERLDGRDGITWDQLQAAKTEVLGPDVVAIEVYPAECDVVNEVNRRHLWEVPSEVVEGLTLRRGS